MFAAFFALMLLGQISLIPIADDNWKIATIFISGITLGLLTAWISRNNNEKKYQRIKRKIEDR